jgi:hypothetical protein
MDAFCSTARSRSSAPSPTAVFLIYVSDAVAYGGSVGVVAYKMFGQAELPYLDFFRASRTP